VIILDTNVVSELMRPAPEAVVNWVDRQPASECYITSVTLAELLHGVARLVDGRRRTELAELIEAMVNDDFDHRVAAFDETADAQIAATCRSHGAILATRNVADFTNTGITIVDPWTAH
jgi:toxin FitB